MTQGATRRCPYCQGTGLGDYWFHNLSDTLTTECHACKGHGIIPLSLVESTLADCDAVRQAAWRKDMGMNDLNGEPLP
jgi:DnaJ-class molecular chaperone